MSYAQKLRLPQQGSYLRVDLSLLSSSPRLVRHPISFFAPQLFLRPRRPRSSSSLIREEEEAETYFAFVSTIYFPFASSANPPLQNLSRSLLLFSLPQSLSLYQPLRSHPRRRGKPAESPPREISWIIINAYAVAGGIERPVGPSFTPHSPLACSPVPSRHHSPLAIGSF